MHLDGAGVDGGQGICDGQFAIVVAVNAQRHGDGCGGCFGEGGDFLRQAAAVGVAQHDVRGAPGDGGGDGLGGVRGVGLPTIEEVFGVVDHLPTLLAEEGDRLADHGEVFFERHAQHVGDVEIVRLADDGDDGGAGVEQGLHAGVVGGLHAATAGHAEGAELGVLQRLRDEPLKELGVLGVRQGIATFDEVEAEVVEPPRDQHLVLKGKADAFALGAVAEGRVVKFDFHIGFEAL